MISHTPVPAMAATDRISTRETRRSNHSEAPMPGLPVTIVPAIVLSSRKPNLWSSLAKVVHGQS